MGSTFKTLPLPWRSIQARVNLHSRFDASRPINIGGFTINDFHGKRRVLSVPEIFIYSSNIGTAKMADAVGTEGHRAFLHKIGLLDKMSTELPEVARPSEPKEWKKLHSITISFGHGASTTPLQTAVAAAALMNGGKLIAPTFLPRTREEADQIATQVVQPETSTKCDIFSARMSPKAQASVPEWTAMMSAARPVRLKRLSKAAIHPTSGSTLFLPLFRFVIRNMLCL